MNALFPGSFHPPTKGHLDVIERCAGIFETVIVAVMANAEKTYAISAEQRCEMLRKCTRTLKNVRVVQGNGLTALFAKKFDCSVIIKGVRDTDDFSNEMRQADINRVLSGIETFLLPSDSRLGSVSSSIVMDIAKNGGDISEFVPESIHDEILRAIHKGV